MTPYFKSTLTFFIVSLALFLLVALSGCSTLSAEERYYARHAKYDTCVEELGRENKKCQRIYEANLNHDERLARESQHEIRSSLCSEAGGVMLCDYKGIKNYEDDCKCVSRESMRRTFHGILQ